MKSQEAKARILLTQHPTLTWKCLNACTYCKTKHARGDLASYPIEELVERARQSFQGEYSSAS
ncbi:threonylcarbamoyladenosine tRNA methylthiotransferase [Tachysurus ichikawai]